MAGKPGRSGGPRPGSGGARPGAGRKPLPPEVKAARERLKQAMKEARPPQPDRECSVYVIHEDGFDSVCKVGIAIDVAKRLSGLQIGCWRQLKVAYAVKLPSEAAAFAVEHAVHQALRPLHVRGEWFRVDALRAMAEVAAAKDSLIAAFTQAKAAYTSVATSDS